MNEADTRAELIDPLLVAAGWGVVEEAAFAASSRSRRGALRLAAGEARA